ncbi:hypothetical protein, partial [Burkholderia cenocepacia]|uniref:hypothetical protein n=1 Tax=Burkholderia cenocepacia TaxID=95486 RepID=UPI001C613393
SASDSRRRVDNLLFNRLAHKNADRFLQKMPDGMPKLAELSAAKYGMPWIALLAARHWHLQLPHDLIFRLTNIARKRVTSTVVTELSITPSIGRESHQRGVGSTQIE